MDYLIGAVLGLAVYCLWVLVRIAFASFRAKRRTGWESVDRQAEWRLAVRKPTCQDGTTTMSVTGKWYIGSPFPGQFAAFDPNDLLAPEVPDDG